MTKPTTHAYVDYRWRNTITNQLQTALDASQDPTNWIREQRHVSVTRVYDEWVPVDQPGDQP